MAKDFNMPGFNLGDDSSPKGEDIFSSGPLPNLEEKIEEKVKSKPILTFDDSSAEKEVPKPEVTEVTKPPVKERKPSKRIWLWITLVLLAIIIGGSYFLHTQGYLKMDYVVTQFNKIKSSIFGGSKDSTDANVAHIPDSTQKVESKEGEVEKHVDNQEKPQNSEVKKEGSSKVDIDKLLKAPEKPTGKTEEKAKNNEKQKNDINNSKKINEKPISKEISKEIKTKESKSAIKKAENANISKTGEFTIQVSAWKNLSKAKNEASKLSKKGYPAKVKSVNLPEKGGRWYRVLIGDYTSRSDAEKQLPNIIKGTSADCVIREK